MQKPQYCILCKKSLFANPNIFICKACEQVEDQTQVSYFAGSKRKIINCPICTYENPQDSIQCYACEFVFQENMDKLQVPKQIKKINSLIPCPKCKLQNHISNMYCINCQNQLFQSIKKQCPICSFSVKQQNYEQHYEQCLMSRSFIQQEEEQIKNIDSIKPQIFQFPQPVPVKKHYGGLQDVKKIGYKHKAFVKQPIKSFKQPMIKPVKGLFGSIIYKVKVPEFLGSKKINCYYCNYKFQSAGLNEHQQNCQKKKQWRRNMEASYSRMTPLQTKAIMHMHQKSAKQHEALREALQGRITKLGHTVEDLNNLQFYIQNYAPIIIQIHVSRHLQFFVKDTHYRSQFETNQSSGSLSRQSRTQWENRMFDNKYDKASDFQRVKYGVINFTNDPKGVQCAKTYGASYFLLKSHVRDRCTFTDMDSSAQNASISTLKYSFSVVNKMNDKQLQAAFKASKALEQSSGVMVTYKQLQIHGPIQFDKDIERIYVCKNQIKGQKNLLDLVYQFSQKFKVEHDFI